MSDVTVTAAHSEDSRDSEYFDTSFMDTVDAESHSSCKVTVLVNNQPEIDTGAEVLIISEKIFTNSLNGVNLQQTTKRWCGPDQKPLEVLGELLVTLSYNDNSCSQQVYVVRHLKQNLLGLPAIKALHLLMLLNSVSHSIPDQYPTLFKGLGTFPEAYDIKLKSDAQPFALFTPKNVPLPLRKKVEEELARMESLQVISKIDEPTPWCAGMVVIPKKSSDSVHICVDFRPLNDSVLREVHSLPKVEEPLVQLSGATVFSKIDANCGFWQIPLTERSRPFTTFIIPFGRYCFNKLPFGICSAPEHFQKQMNNILSGLPGVLCHMDDVLIFGSTQQEHDDQPASQSVTETSICRSYS